MKLSESFSLAIRTIVSRKMRTFLTMLGIIIGVMAVIVIVGLGNGMQNYIRESFADLGTNTLTAMVMGRGSSRSVSVDQMYEIASDHADKFDALSPTVSLSDTVRIGDKTPDETTVTGVSEDYFGMKDYEISSGRGIWYSDVMGRGKVCVIGEYLANTYFDGSPIGQTLRIGANRFTIVGVMAAETDDVDEGGTDDCIFLPYSTAARISYTGTITSFTYTLKDENEAETGKTIIENALYLIFEDSNAYTVISNSEILDTMNSMVNMIIYVLAGIAAISLVVGGIGIMNIMLVSVTERTQEIGIRKALGAKERYIMQQFVMEAATTSALGGALGIAGGYLVSAVATKVITAVLDTAITVAPTMGAVALAFGVSAGIGIAFGYLPAKKAAQLNPIDALHYD
ncbi:MAG: ABC transporter permease [Oscillospiraceae bacterium]|nr:ABC transporter permease [Oscillospiraceae bacterium]